MRILKLAPLYLPPAEYFRAMANADMAVIDISMPYDKRFKAVHRTRVSDSRGANSLLTVPVSKYFEPHEGRRLQWADVRVSPHGEWWRVQRLTLATLFGPTPFFDLYRHDIFPFMDQNAVGRPITDVNIDLIVAVRRLASIDTPLSVVLDPRYMSDPGVEIVDMRRVDFYADENAVSVVETLFNDGSL